MIFNVIIYMREYNEDAPWCHYEFIEMKSFIFDLSSYTSAHRVEERVCQFLDKSAFFVCSFFYGFFSRAHFNDSPKSVSLQHFSLVAVHFYILEIFLFSNDLLNENAFQFLYM